MATYLILNCIIIVVAGLLLYRWVRRPLRPYIVTLVILLALTAIFDNVIIGLGIVDYDPHKILGLKILFAPIEDFMYPLLSAVAIPALWYVFGERHDW